MTEDAVRNRTKSQAEVATVAASNTAGAAVAGHAGGARDAQCVHAASGSRLEPLFGGCNEKTSRDSPGKAAIDTAIDQALRIRLTPRKREMEPTPVNTRRLRSCMLSGSQLAHEAIRSDEATDVARSTAQVSRRGEVIVAKEKEQYDEEKKMKERDHAVTERAAAELAKSEEVGWKRARAAQAAEAARVAAERQLAEEKARQEQEDRARESAARVAEEQRVREEKARQEEEDRARARAAQAAEAARVAQEQRVREEKARQEQEERARSRAVEEAEAARVAEEQRLAEKTGFFAGAISATGLETVSRRPVLTRWMHPAGLLSSAVLVVSRKLHAVTDICCRTAAAGLSRPHRDAVKAVAACVVTDTVSFARRAKSSLVLQWRALSCSKAACAASNLRASTQGRIITHLQTVDAVMRAYMRCSRPLFACTYATAST